MIAVIETGGKQYLVKPGDALKIEKLDAESGTEITFDKILFLAEDDGADVRLGTPYIEGATLTALVEAQGRSKKIRVIKYKCKVRYKRVHGHRQAFTKVKVKSVASN